MNPPDGGQPDGAFGWDIDAAEGHGVTILVAGEPVYGLQPHLAPGTVYFYRFDPAAGEWTHEAQVQAPDPYERDGFGWSISVGVVHDEPGLTHRAVVGRPNDGAFGGNSGPGAAFVYTRSEDGTWQLEQRLDPPFRPLDEQEFG